MRIASYIGRKFGDYEVTGMIEASTGKNNGGKWICKCNCGNEFECDGYNLHWRKSCGHLQVKMRKENGIRNRRPKEVSMNCSYLSYKANCRTRKFEPLSKEEWRKIATQPCYYCGGMDRRNKAKMNSYKRNFTVILSDEVLKSYEVEVNGIDRLNSKEGYVEGNMVPCCGMCNRMKNSFTLEDFFEKVKIIYNKHILKSEF